MFNLIRGVNPQVAFGALKTAMRGRTDGRQVAESGPCKGGRVGGRDARKQRSTRCWVAGSELQKTNRSAHMECIGTPNKSPTDTSCCLKSWGCEGVTRCVFFGPFLAFSVPAGDACVVPTLCGQPVSPERPVLMADTFG
jgi:hypothetical protein